MFRKYFLSLLALILILSACSSPAAQSSGPISLTDGLKRTITLSKPAQRIVSLAPSNTEILYAIGAAGQVVGRDEFSDYPAEAKNLPSVGGSFGKYNYEAVVNLKPDLVLAAEINTPEQVDALQKLGLTVYYLSNPTTLDGMYQNLDIVAQLSGHTKEANTLIDGLKKRVEAVQTKVKEAKMTPSVFYELDATNPSAPYTAGPGTFVSLLIQMAGGKNLGDSLDKAWAEISMEKLLVSNPDLIILGDSAYGETPQKVAQRAGWNVLQAVKNQKVYTFDDNLVSRPGPRLVDGLEAMAKLVHPELFK